MSISRPQLVTTVILTYIALLFAHVPLHGQLIAADLLAPVIALLLLDWRVSKALEEQPYRALLGFLGMAALAALCHALVGNGERGYDLAVFMYLAGLFVFVRVNPLPPRVLMLSGLLMIALLFVAWLAELTAFFAGGQASLGFAYISTQMDNTAMSFLARRFAFTFGNPNTLGSFYVLPMAMLLCGLTPYARHFRAWQWLLCLAGLGLSLLPLVHSFSKHAVMTGAVMLAFLVDALRPRWPRLASVAWLPIVGIGLLCTATVLWVVFPLSPDWPWINTSSGMYTIHQGIYARMAMLSPMQFLLGHSPTEIRQLYPLLADHDAIATTLQHYNAGAALESFANFMDPHQEYLNILTLFGAPALAAVIFFWWTCCRKASTMARYLIIAIAFCCLWDDLLSKRWLWIAAAILLQNHDPANTMKTPPEGNPPEAPPPMH